MIRVLVADDQAAVRDGFAALIDAQENMLVAGRAKNGREAVDLARRTFPHVVLMDIRMPVLDGLQATRLICSDPTPERTRVLVLTTFDLTTTSTARCAQAPLASSSKTPRAANWCTRSR
jgi:YesN/AraC family two-component response regulator